MDAVIARVMVDIAHTNVDRTFDYRIPPHLVQDVVPGMRVFVPFGPQNRRTEAFVLEVGTGSEVAEDRLKDVLCRIDPYPALWPDQIALARSMAARYGCLLVDALRLMLPAPLRGRAVEGREHVTARVAGGVDAAETARLLEKRAPVQARVLTLLSEAGRMGLSDIESAIKGGTAAVRALEKKGLVQKESVRALRRPYADLDADVRPRPALNAGQARAAGAITAAVNRGGEFLLHGVTGSGKTEVYMRAVEACRAMGRGALVLVPEIALTPQIMAQFIARFGKEVALLHSRLSEGERMDEWERIVTGQAGVVVGARSAVFAPLQDIGVIVIDEEQETSYHSQIHPRYHAADVARERAAAQRGHRLLQRYPFARNVPPRAQGRNGHTAPGRLGWRGGPCPKWRSWTCATSFGAGTARCSAPRCTPACGRRSRAASRSCCSSTGAGTRAGGLASTAAGRSSAGGATSR